MSVHKHNFTSKFIPKGNKKRLNSNRMGKQQRQKINEEMGFREQACMQAQQKPIRWRDFFFQVINFRMLSCFIQRYLYFLRRPAVYISLVV